MGRGMVAHAQGKARGPAGSWRKLARGWNALARGRHTAWRVVLIMPPHRPAIDPSRT